MSSKEVRVPQVSLSFVIHIEADPQAVQEFYAPPADHQVSAEELIHAEVVCWLEGLDYINRVTVERQA